MDARKFLHEIGFRSDSYKIETDIVALCSLMEHYAKYYYEQQVKSGDLAQVGKPWSEMKDGDEMILRCRKVKGKFELCSE